MDGYLAIGNSGGDCLGYHCDLRQAIAATISLLALVHRVGAVNAASLANDAVVVSADCIAGGNGINTVP